MNESFLQFTTYCVNILLIIENPKLLTKKKNINVRPFLKSYLNLSRSQAIFAVIYEARK